MGNASSSVGLPLQRPVRMFGPSLFGISRAARFRTCRSVRFRYDPVNGVSRIYGQFGRSIQPDGTTGNNRESTSIFSPREREIFKDGSFCSWREV